MQRKKINMTLADAWSDAMESDLDRLIAWYNQHGDRNMSINIFIAADHYTYLEQMTWIIMRFRMGKIANRGDPKFHLCIDRPLCAHSMDLIAGLDSRLPRLLLTPRATATSDMEEPIEFLASFQPSLEGRIIETRPFFDCRRPDTELEPLLKGLAALGDGALPAKMEAPAIEVPYDAAFDDGRALCRNVARLWETVPSVSQTLGWFESGYVKRFYQLKELWHLAQFARAGTIHDDVRTLADDAACKGANPDKLK